MDKTKHKVEDRSEEEKMESQEGINTNGTTL